MASVVDSSKPINLNPWGDKAPKCTLLDRDSVLKAFPKGTNQVMIFGLTHCLYKDVMARMLDMEDDRAFPIREVFNWQVGCPGVNALLTTTVEGRNMNIIRFEPSQKWPQSQSRPCKAALDDLILENCKRTIEGRPLIPLGFIIDITDNPEPLTIKAILERNESPDRITPFEIRHIEKLMTAKNRLIAKVAQETVIFLGMKKGAKEGSYSLERAKSPIDEKMSAQITERQKSSKTKAKDAQYSWRIQMDKDLFAFEASRLRIESPTPSYTVTLPDDSDDEEFTLDSPKSDDEAGAATGAVVS